MSEREFLIFNFDRAKKTGTPFETVGASVYFDETVDFVSQFSSSYHNFTSRKCTVRLLPPTHTSCRQLQMSCCASS